MENTAQPLRVPHKILSAVLQADEIPQFGSAPPFPWSALESQVAQQLKLDGLQLQHGDGKWSSGEELESDLGDDVFRYAAKLNGVEGDVLLLITEDHLDRMLSWLLTQGESRTRVPDEEIRSGLKKFLGLELCHCLDQLGYLDGMSPMLSAEESNAESFFCFDITAHFAEQTLVARLAISDEFLHAWRGRFAQQRTAMISDEMAARLPMAVHLESGHVQLSKEQWDALKPGDCLLPDQLFLELAEDGRAVRGYTRLQVNGIAVAHGRVKRNGTVEITQTA